MRALLALLEPFDSDRDMRSVAFDNRALPSLPVQSAVPAQQPLVHKRTLPTWSRNKTAMKVARPKAQTPEPTKSAWPKSMPGPLGESVGAALFGEGGGSMNAVRLHGSYPRLIGADSDVILWDLRKAQQTLADFQHKLATREVADTLCLVGTYSTHKPETG